jgi:transposase
MRAADMFAKGASQADVAAHLGVSRQTASQWHACWSDGGKNALRGAGRAGRLPKLTDEQLAEVEAALLNGAKANGFPTDLWTLPRVAEVIERITHVSYSPGHVWWILRKRMDWSRQRPARRAVERDEEAIANWIKNRWPKVKKTPGDGERGSASKTKAASASSHQ